MTWNIFGFISQYIFIAILFFCIGWRSCLIFSRKRVNLNGYYTRCYDRKHYVFDCNQNALAMGFTLKEAQLICDALNTRKEV